MNTELLQLADDLGNDHPGRQIYIILGDLTLGDFLALKGHLAERYPSIEIDWRPAGYQ